RRKEKKVQSLKWEDVVGALYLQHTKRSTDMSPSASNEREPIIWSGRPSQVVNAKTFFWCFVFCWLIVPLFIALWHWLVVRNVEYTLTRERLRIRQGVFNKQLSDLELYRVKDLHVLQPFLLRIFRKSNIILFSSDRSHPE